MRLSAILCVDLYLDPRLLLLMLEISKSRQLVKNN
jgi:hypothetical protein